MATVQMNSRIDEGLKERYERVLSKHGWQHSQVMRQLCEYVADEGDLPDLRTASQRDEQAQARARRLKALSDFSGCVKRELAGAGLMSSSQALLPEMTDAELKEWRRDSLGEDYLADLQLRRLAAGV